MSWHPTDDGDGIEVEKCNNVRRNRKYWIRVRVGNQVIRTAGWFDSDELAYAHARHLRDEIGNAP